MTRDSLVVDRDRRRTAWITGKRQNRTLSVVRCWGQRLVSVMTRCRSLVRRRTDFLVRTNGDTRRNKRQITRFFCPTVMVFSLEISDENVITDAVVWACTGETNVQFSCDFFRRKLYHFDVLWSNHIVIESWDP